MRTLTVTCPDCGSPVVTNHTHTQYTPTALLDCSCKNNACGHRYVMDLTLSHLTGTKKTPANKAPTAKPVIRRLKALVYCPTCSQPASITAKHVQTANFLTLYCTCGNGECGQRFVTNATFSHSTVAPTSKAGDLLSSFIRMMTPEQKKEALHMLRGA
ncbi:TPA: ogr/Delta-like zinc finger family protein [Yersinia enterocolitica]|uniref:ogr/Delta-like zinc finger family protein n=1 Tax=Yersinia TaxID=629 RepID=UPI0025AA708F|nr:ogr/Delta-like zinc finger family protein [Yersinia rohdei]EMA7646763.1 ogr/Delta-like zinc finger family protein [Yersinia enterocolitica]MDN0094136.1 ogr/Delta-like zinc finger family protein [Yersinia rohdei]HDL6748653.1 ogr/Delta-like zinc finger family protein [Yersinia enterocolitica]HDL8096012.1 ogr/Delta-like zinc finger family protein [Yersinia enterocolitica]HDL8482820.1 ogr/Delta-like zinc finger family protein [Yersinia enterocolitica]